MRGTSYIIAPVVSTCDRGAATEVRFLRAQELKFVLKFQSLGSTRRLERRLTEQPLGISKPYAD